MKLPEEPESKLDEDRMWRAVQTRDFRYFASFVYAVRSSGTFCRPTCPSRRPSRDRVEFFDSPLLALNSGYRACLRCKPDDLDEIPVSISAVQKACDFIEENYASRISLRNLAAAVGQSPYYLHRNFSRLTGVTPKEYLEAVRMKRAKSALKQGESTRNSTYQAGHSSASWMYGSSAAAKLGMSPSLYKSGGDGLKIVYVISDSPLGRILVGATERGICFICLGSTDEKLVGYLRDEYPRADISQESAETKLGSWVSEIIGYLEGKNRLAQDALPLDVSATAFQMSVWKELQKIPYGRTASYNEIAEKIGRPNAYRAVANACASNRVPLVIPCHRVVRKNGNLGGYRWGVERKKKLLAIEANASR